jgi:hypothetical protein
MKISRFILAAVLLGGAIGMAPAANISQTGFTNTVMRGSSTNFSVFFTNTTATTLYWQVVNTSSWITLSATNGTIPTNETCTAIVTNSITNSAVGLDPRTYNGFIVVYLTNASLNTTGTVDMALNVAEFGRSPTQVTATVKQFGTTSATVTVWNAGAGNLAYTVTTNVSWMSVRPVSGILTGQTSNATNTLLVTFTNVLLSVETHYGTLTLNPNGISGSPLDINVALTVTNGPQMTVSPLALTGTVMMGQNLSCQTTRVSNGSSTEQISYYATVNHEWLTVSPTNCTIDAAATSNLVVTYLAPDYLTTNSAGGLSNHTATITVTATNPVDVGGSPASVAVSLTVNPRSYLGLSTPLLTNIVTEGYDAPDCTFEVWNSNGYYTLYYDISDNVDWLVATPSSGTSTGEHHTITVEFSTTYFTAVGISNAVITIVGRAYDGVYWDNAIEATQTVQVSLMVVPSASLATDAASNYRFSTYFGRPVGSQTFRVWNGTANGSVLQYTIATNVNWMSAYPSSGTSAGEHNSITLSCNVINLVPGKYNGVLTITGTDRATGAESYNSPTNINVQLTIIGNKGFNFGGEGNGASDLIVYKQSSGLWSITNLHSGYSTSVVFCGKGYAPVPGDYDNDGISDLGAYRYSSGYWYLRRITEQTLVLFGGSYWAGPELVSLGGYVPVAGDYDGDGRTDPAMYCELTGLWSALFSASGYAYVSGAFGGEGYTAIPADYDGDGKIDTAVYNESTAQWYALYSGDNNRLISGTFGGPGFTAVPADYDGDCKADPSIYNRTTGLWIILPSSTLSSQGYRPISGFFGGTGFEPVPADYNGDGSADACIYEELTGYWYIVSLNGTRIAWPVKHGSYGFAPVKP